MKYTLTLSGHKWVPKVEKWNIFSHFFVFKTILNKLASLKRNQWKGHQPFVIRDSFCSRFQCWWFSGLSLISILIRFSFVSYTWMAFLVMKAWPVCVSVTQGIDQNFWCYGIKANTKGNTITINMSMCRKPFCSAVNLCQSSEFRPAATPMGPMWWTKSQPYRVPIVSVPLVRVSTI